MFAQGCLRCTTRSEARVQRPAPSPHTAASPTSRYPRNSPTAPRAPSPYSGRYGHRHLLVPMLLFISKTTRAVIRVTPMHITVIWHHNVSVSFDGTFASSLFQVSLMLPVRFCLISCLCVSHALFVLCPNKKSTVCFASRGFSSILTLLALNQLIERGIFALLHNTIRAHPPDLFCNPSSNFCPLTVTDNDR